MNSQPPPLLDVLSLALGIPALLALLALLLYVLDVSNPPGW